MRNPTKIFSTYILAILFLAGPYIAFADEFIENTNSKPSGGINFDCIDLFKFGSLYTKVNTANTDIKKGDNVIFQGEIINSNNFPVTNVGVFVKIVKNLESDVSINVDVIDQFYAAVGKDVSSAKDGISAQTKFSFTWKVPTTLPPGKYSVLSYTLDSNNLSINSFSLADDVATASFNFEVKGETSSRPPYFEKASLSLNNEKYLPVGFHPQILSNETVNISASLINEKDTPSDITLKWTVYKKGTLLDKDIAERKTEKIKLTAGEKRAVSFVPHGLPGSEVFVVGEAHSYDSKSFVTLSFGNYGVKKGKFNISGIGQYMTGEATSSYAFACYSTKNVNYGEGATISTRLVDNNGKTILQDVSELNISSDISTYIKSIPNGAYENPLVLFAEIKNGDEILDEISLKYPCNDESDSNCVGANAKKATSSRGAVSESNAILLVVISLLSIIVAAIYFMNHKRGVNHIYYKGDGNSGQ